MIVGYTSIEHIPNFIVWLDWMYYVNWDILFTILACNAFIYYSLTPADNAKWFIFYMFLGVVSWVVYCYFMYGVGVG